MVPLRRLFTLLVLSVSFAFAQTPTWTNLEHGLGANLNELNSVAFGNGIFVAIKTAMTGGTLHYATSTDGTTWIARTVSTSITSSGGANRVRFLNGRFLIMPVGISGGSGVALALTSTDGLTWTSATVGNVTTSPDEMDFGNGRVLAVGSNAYFVGSTDFSTWSSQSTPLAGLFGFQDVAFGNGRWFVTTNGGGEVATSTDGINFTKVEGLTALGGFRVEYGNNRWFFYSQQNNAVSDDGVAFTTVVRTPNVTPGGTGTIRFLNGRFLAYGPSTFQASTDGQTWTNFGAIPSLGAGYVYTALYDFAYGNGKYVAVGGRDFPSSKALIFVTDGLTDDDGGTGSSGSFTLAFQLSVSALPGTTAPVTRSFRGYALHNGGVIMASANADDTTTTLLQHKNGALTTLREAVGGMPEGGTMFMGEIASDGSVLYFTPRSRDVNFAHHGALFKLENGTLSTEIANSNTLIDRQNSTSSSFTAPSAAAGSVAFIGRRGITDAYIFKRTGSTTSVVAEAGVTSQPNGTGDGKFARFEKVLLAADGRVFFDGYNGVHGLEPDFRRGVYVAQNGGVSVVLDHLTLVPGTTTPFRFSGSDPLMAVSPDGSKLIVRAGNNDFSSSTSERHGIYLYSNGALTRMVDNATSVNGSVITYVGEELAVTNDGTVFFSASAGMSTDLFRAKDGVVTLFQYGGAGSQTISPSGLWVHQGQVFFQARKANLGYGLFRKPADGSGEAELVLDLSTHPDFKAIDARDVEHVAFAGDQVLISVGAVAKGVQRSALLYGAASNILGEAGSASAPASAAVAPGGSASLSTTAAGPIQWQRNGANVLNGTTASLSLTNIHTSDTGIYSAAVNGTATVAQSAIVGLSIQTKVVGTATEIAANILHPSGNTYDQILLEGAAASFTADTAQNQVTRLSFIDLTDDIVQVEFSGPGTVSIVLEGSSGPAGPVNYNQNVNYVKGHAGIVVTGATENTHLSIFSVGRGNAVNQALFKDNVAYDGLADIAFIAIHSSNGKFGGLRTANTSYWNTQGFTGVFAPNVQFTGPVYVHDISAQEHATPVLVLGSAQGNTWITGGNLAQANGRAVQVGGLTQLKMADGVTSHYRASVPDASEYLTAQANQAKLEQDGVDVTGTIIVNP